MKIYKIITYNNNVIINHGYFDFVECQSKLVELTLKDDIEKIEIFLDNVKTYSKKEYENV